MTLMNSNSPSRSKKHSVIMLSSAFLRSLLLSATAIFILPAVLLAFQQDRNQLDLTVYQGFGWVQDTRVFELMEGINEIQFSGISRQLDPGSVHVESDGRLMSLRTNMGHYGWDQSFMNLKGEQVRLISDYGELIEGEIADYVQGRLYLRKADGNYTLIPNPHSYRMEFREVPDPSVSGADISAKVKMPSAGSFPVMLTYVLNNIGWNMDYSLFLNEDAGVGELTGLAGIRNDTGIEFGQAAVRLVAGQVNVSPGHFPGSGDTRSEAMAMASRPDTEPDRYSDFYVYDIPEKLNLEKQEIFHFPLIASNRVSFQKKYRHTIRPFSASNEEPRNTDIQFVLTNSGSEGLGKPMPAGNVRVYTRDGEDNVRLIGQDRISHTASGDDVHLRTGKAFDIRVLESVTDRMDISRNVREEVREITAKNETENSVTVTLEVPLHRNISIVATDAEPVIDTADRQIFEITVPPEGEQVMKVTLRQGN